MIEMNLDVVLRTVIVYFFILIGIRIAGKKELSQLNTSDIVLILLISNAVQNAMVGVNTSLLGGIIAASVLFLLNYILKHVLFKNSKFRDFLNDKPYILIHDGKLDFKSLAKLEISNDELLEAVHEHGLENFKDVKLAIMEVDGNISVISQNETAKISNYKRKKHHRNTVNLN